MYWEEVGSMKECRGGYWEGIKGYWDVLGWHYRMLGG